MAAFPLWLGLPHCRRNLALSPPSTALRSLRLFSERSIGLPAYLRHGRSPLRRAPHRREPGRGRALGPRIASCGERTRDEGSATARLLPLSSLRRVVLTLPCDVRVRNGTSGL